MLKFKRLRVFVISFLMILSGTVNGQVQEGNVLVDAYFMGPTANAYGQIIWPNALTRSSYRRLGSALGFGIKADYMILDKLSIGVDANFAVGGYQYQEVYYDYNNNITIPDAIHRAKYNKIRAMLTSNFYFLNREKLSIYTGVGIGYYTRNSDYKVNGQTVAPFDDLFFVDQNFFVPFQLPLAGRVRIGLKYFFTENIGGFIEAGLGGGALLEFGLALKF